MCIACMLFPRPLREDSDQGSPREGRDLFRMLRMPQRPTRCNCWHIQYNISLYCVYYYLYVCIYIYIYIHIYVHIYVYMYIYTCLFIRRVRAAATSTSSERGSTPWTSRASPAYICIYVLYIYIYMYMCTYIYIYMYIERERYTQTQISLSLHIHVYIIFRER